MDQAVVSVVTPFHNTAEFLGECIESVLGQEHRGFEYILVDNASTDGSRSVAQRYAERDRRVRLLQTPKLLSQVENYNFALRAIDPASTYCKVVQADDWIFPRCLTEMLAIAVENPRCGVISAYELSGVKVFGDFMDPGERVVDGREAGRRFMMENFHVFGSPTTVMYRSDLVRARPDFYEVGRLHEDTEAVIELMLVSDLGFVPQVLTYTRHRQDSISASTQYLLTQLLDQLIVVTRFGPQILSPDDYEKCLRQKRRTYYRALARKALKSARGVQPGFWQFQREGLATIGESIDKWEVVRNLPGGLVERLIPGRG